MIFSEKIDEILGHGFFLGEIGISNWALDRNQCLTAIENLKKIKVPILGGDTFLDGKINPTGDSWSCDKMSNENDEEFLERSANESVNFVCNPVNEEFKFIIVPGFL